MKPEGWQDEDMIIRCKRVPADFDREGTTILNCELCDATIAAAPITVEKQGQPTWHVVCENCFAKIVPGEEIKYLGRFGAGTTKLP